MYESLEHNFEPVYDENSKILILGTFPSVKSREEGFYYGNKRNRFWPILSSLLNEKLPENIESKKALLLHHNIALWDVARSCEIENSSDSSIKNVVPNDINMILKHSNVSAIFLNGKTAGRLYQKLIGVNSKTEIFIMPSTSPANASFSLEKLQNEWRKILEFVQ